MNEFSLKEIKSGFYIKINVEAERSNKDARCQLLTILDALIERLNKSVLENNFVFIVDFSSFAYIDTYCLARLITLKTVIENNKGKLITVSGIEKIQRLLITTKMDEKLNLFPSLDDVAPQYF